MPATEVCAGGAVDWLAGLLGELAGAVGVMLVAGWEAGGCTSESYRETTISLRCGRETYLARLRWESSGDGRRLKGSVPGGGRGEGSVGNGSGGGAEGGGSGDYAYDTQLM